MLNKYCCCCCHLQLRVRILFWPAHAHLSLTCTCASHLCLRMHISFLPAHAPLIFCLRIRISFLPAHAHLFLPAHAHLILACACASHLDLLMRISIWPARAHLIWLAHEDLRRTCSWCCQNSLLISADKTKILIIGVPQFLRRVPNVAISILGKEITPVPVARDLGVFIDQYLTYDEHLTQTAANCLCKLVQINRIKPSLGQRKHFYY